MKIHKFTTLDKDGGIGLTNDKGNYVGIYINLYNFLRKRKAKKVSISNEPIVGGEVAPILEPNKIYMEQNYIATYKNFWGNTKMMEVSICKGSLVTLFNHVPEILYYKILK